MVLMGDWNEPTKKLSKRIASWGIGLEVMPRAEVSRPRKPFSIDHFVVNAAGKRMIDRCFPETLFDMSVHYPIVGKCLPARVSVDPTLWNQSW